VFPRLFTIDAFELFGRSWGPLTLHTYGVLLAAAFIAGLWVVTLQAKRAGLDAGRIADMAVYVLIAGLLGAKVLLLLIEWEHYSRNLRELFSLVQSGGVFYGGLLGAIPVAWWYARRHALPPWATADVLAPGVVLGQGIGRLGCFAAGCCHGRPTSVPWAVTFRDEYAARVVGTPLDTPLHPAQLYESAACMALLGVLLWMSRRKAFHGQIALAYVGLYALVRFAIEFFRGDVARGTVFGGVLSTSQFIALVMAAVVALMLPYVAKKNRVALTTPPAPADPPAPAAA
jgi:phosphatidylglycerol:prolipoprotein diacylglycerol transferase